MVTIKSIGNKNFISPEILVPVKMCQIFFDFFMFWIINQLSDVTASQNWLQMKAETKIFSKRNSTTTPLLIFPNFFPQISKHVDCTGLFYCLKWHPGQNVIYNYFFRQKPTLFDSFFIRKWPNFGIMAKFTYNHIFRGEKVRRGMFMP